MNKKEYNKILLKYYKKNNANIEKWIFLGSTGALSILVSFCDKINQNCFPLFTVSIICFLITIIMQLISAHISKKGCDLGLDEEGKFNEESCKCFDVSETLNKCFMITFVVALIMTTITIINNSHQGLMKNINSEKSLIIEQTVKAKDFEYHIKERRL